MNKLIEQTRKQIRAKVNPKLLPVVHKLAEAGKQVMYSPQTREMTIAALKDARDPESIGAAVAKLAGILYNQSKRTAPMQALVPAAMLLLCEGLQFLEEAGAVQVTPDMLAQSTMAMTSTLLQLLGATPEQISGYMQKGQAAQPAAAQPSEPSPQPSGIVGGAQGAMP